MELSTQLQLAEIFAPMQIAMLLIIALIVFGPDKLPEIGKQIGGAIRDLKRATGDVMKTMNTGYEPENNYYSYDDNSASYSAYQPYQALPPSVDYSDYTIAGVAPKESTVAQAASQSESYADYTLAYDSKSPSGGSGEPEPTPAG